VAAAAVALASLLAGCAGRVKPDERAARQSLRTVQQHFPPATGTNALPALTPASRLEDFLAYAMRNQPAVQAAYFDWAASVERITVDRSLPDPQFTFQTFNTATLLSALMPGLVMEFPGPGKLAARGAVASAESQAKYFAFETAVLQSAFAVKKAYYQLHFLADKVRINRETLRLLAGLETLARAQNEVGKGTLQDVLRAQMERDRTAVELANLEDSRSPLIAQFKAALGWPAGAANPPLPARFESTPLDVTSDQLFTAALVHNPRLKALEAEVRAADAGLRLARKDNVPDFTAGLSADLKAAPVMWNPQAGVTLPIWRDKVAADIAAAQAAKRSAQARLSAEQIALAVDFADQLFTYRESGRNLALLRDKLIPKARASLDVAQAGYLGGQLDFFNLIDAERALLNFQLAEVEARTQREMTLAEISLLILGQPPADAPVLPPQTNAPVANLPAHH
jgi:outer membrane protein TolC